MAVKPLFYRVNELHATLGISRATIWSWVKQGKFPAPIKLGENTTAWPAEVIEAWAADRIAASSK